MCRSLAFLFITTLGISCASATELTVGPGGFKAIGGRVVKQSYGTDWGEADEGIHCVAAPVFDRPNHLLAVVWASAVAGRMPKARFPKVAVEVMKAAREIERRLRA
jgi:IclR family transcriptional regulator, KDG regulon repressor